MMETVEIRNAEIKLSSLRSDALVAATQLSSISYRIESAKKEEETIKREYNRMKALLENVVSKSEKKIEENRKKFAEFCVNKESYLKKITEEKRESGKELRRLNTWILSARDEEKTLTGSLASLKLKIVNTKPIIERILKLENELKELQKKKELSKLENEELKKQGRKEIDLLKDEVKKITNSIESLKKEAEYASYRKKRIDDECFLKLSDLTEYTERVKSVWDKVFPGVKMPMLK